MLTTALALDRQWVQLQGVVCFADLLHAESRDACARALLEFVVAHPATIAPDREQVAAQLAAWPAGAAAASPWPGIELAELTQRIVGEASLGHARLIAALTTAP